MTGHSWPSPMRLAANAVLVSIGFTCSTFPLQAAPASNAGVAWQYVSTDREVDKAFEAGKKSGKPIFLYWGAVWCPPCNQVKATLFSRSDFVERSRAFIPVYVDGDKPGAQKVAARFKVQGYPTMILFKPDGTEVTRLPGEVDPQRYLLTLTAGLEAQTPVKELLQRARSRQALNAEQWRLLAYYSWETDEQQVVASSALPGQLAELARAAPANLPEVRNRLALKALAAGADASAGANAKGEDANASMKFLEPLLADPVASEQLSDLLIWQAESIVKFLAPAGDGRRSLASRWDAALARLAVNPALSKADRIDALDARVGMWKMIDATEKLSAARQSLVLREVSQIVASTTDRYERQAVVPRAGSGILNTPQSG